MYIIIIISNQHLLIAFTVYFNFNAKKRKILVKIIAGNISVM